MEKTLAPMKDLGSSDRFAYEWSHYDTIIPEYEQQFLKWVSPLTKDFFQDKTILDAGCGIGRNSYWPLCYGAASVDAFDYAAPTVAVARRNLARFANANVFQESIYNLDEKNTYDLAFSIGVIHHLERPHDAVRRLYEAAKPDGKVLIWVYGYEGNEWIVRYVNPVRAITSRLPVMFVHMLAALLTMPLYLFVRLLPQKHPYFKQLDSFKFWHIQSIIFDQLLPRIVNYWTRDQALELFHSLPVKEIQALRVNNNSWTIIAKK